MCDLVIHDAHKVKVVECSPLSPVLDKVLEGDIDDVVNELENGKSLVNVVPIAWPGSQSTLLSMVTQSDFPSGRIQELIVSLLNRGMLSGVFYGLDGQSVTRLESNVINHSLVLQLSLRGLLKKGAGDEERATIESLFTQGIQFHMVKKDIDIIAKEVDRIAAEKSSQRWRDLKDILLDRSPRSLFHLCRHDIMRHLSTVSGAKLKLFDSRHNVSSTSASANCTTLSFVPLYVNDVLNVMITCVRSRVSHICLDCPQVDKEISKKEITVNFKGFHARLAMLY
ncbi:hypothetical protein CAPTEDRAFT_204373 [Capitella teleta]|uniref:Uncharacterized protein n=1 Tax=Capitella teleta TaxID=283909 RepID=R7V3E2_CAPTE|nr:hypothetical protein CAPTEDRAFT_204373 [Capitella teleta]|eukprot:ELU10851.1 hypothetical protein CAPTEDRAFT_204373 [Capitella teleta]